MAILKKTLFDERLENINVLVNDTEPNSRYFNITELPATFSGGKNAFLIQGSSELVADTVVKVQVRDSQGKIIYNEPGEGIPEYYEGTSKVVSVYIYPDTSFGPCTITILGELSEYVTSTGISVPTPDNWKDTYNVKWEKRVNVNPLLANTTKIRFYRRPKIDITESVLPIYNRSVITRVISGSINGTAQNPIEGADYKQFKGILRYELSMNGSNIFSQSMEGSTINITGLGSSYAPILTDVTTDKTSFVNIPYYQTSSISPSYQSVKSFTSASFTLSYSEDATVSNSSVSSSFASIKLTDLETFSGDAYRIKIYGSSKNDLGDFQLLEDVQLESAEILQTGSFENILNVRTGMFSTPVLNTFWTSSPLSTTVTSSIDNSRLLKSVVLTPTSDSYVETGLFKFYTLNTINFIKNTEYQLDFTPLLNSATDGYGNIEVYLSGSAFVNTKSTNDYGKRVLELSTNTAFRKYDKQQINFKPDADGNGQLVFLVRGGLWQIADISLRASQESSFSPNEISLSVNVPVKITGETFDFRFEIYDINNNYVPVKLEKSYTFTGGNDIAIKKDLQLNVSSTAFNFSTSSVFPQFITIDYVKTALSGAVVFNSSSFDTNGNVISGSPQPGGLTYVDDDTKKLTLQSFTGSLSGTTVGAVSYTASCDGINRYFTVFRIDQGAPARLFYATADKNNFTYDPDDNNKSSIVDDYIDIRLVQQNLPSYTGVGLTIYSGSEVGSPPPLVSQGSIGNASVYRLYATSSTHLSSVDGYSYDIGQSHYDFSLITTDGPFTSSVTIDAILKGDKGKGLFASVDRNQFFYKMTDLAPTPSSQTATILVKRQNLGSLTNTISVTKTGSGPDLTYVGTSSGVATYTLTAGQSTNYQYNSGTTKYTFSAYDLNGVLYSDEISIAPVISEAQISVNLSNENTTLPSLSTGYVAAGAFSLTNGVVSVKVGGEDITRQEGLSTNNRWDIISATGTGCTPVNTAPTDATYGITALSADSGSLSLVVRYKDGRGTTTDVTKVVTYSKAKTASPTTVALLSSETQAVEYTTMGGYASAATFTVTANEGAGNYSYNAGLSSNSTYYVSVSSGGSNSSGTVTPTTPSSVSGTTVNLVIYYKNSEGTTGNISKTHKVSVSAQGAAGADGAAGSNGTNGTNGTNGSNGVNGTVITISPASQTVSKSIAGAYGTPVNFTISVVESGTSYSYSTGVGSINTFDVTSITGGSNSSGTVTPTTPSTMGGTTVSFTVRYKNSVGTIVSVSQTHIVSVALDGSTGPGIVFTGEWNSGRSYQFDISNGRRDAVLLSGTYYATKAAPPVGTSPTNTTYWESLGTADFFVAAKIAIFDESFVKNTLNIGTNNNGGVASANITLAGSGTSPYISIGQSGTIGSQGYGLNGLFMGMNGGTAKFSAVNGTTNYLKWDGTSLDVKGTINATAGNFSGNITSTATITGGVIEMSGSVGVFPGNARLDNTGLNIYDFSGNRQVTIGPIDSSTNGVVIENGALSLKGATGFLDCFNGVITGNSHGLGAMTLGLTTSYTNKIAAGLSNPPAYCFILIGANGPCWFDGTNYRPLTLGASL